MALLLALPQECDGPQDRTGLDTGDLATALEEADKELYAKKQELNDLNNEFGRQFGQIERLVSENNLLAWDVERAGRAHVLNNLERVLMRRYVAPVDVWMENPYAAGEPYPRPKDGSRWYALVIEPPNKLRNDSLWVKFYIDAGEAGSLDTMDNEAHDEVMKPYVKRRRDGLVDALEHHFVLSMQDPATVTTIIDGTPHLYRLVSKDSDVDKLRPADRIY